MTSGPTDPVRRLARLRRAARGPAALSDQELLKGLARALRLWAGPGGYAARAARELARLEGASEVMLRCGLNRTVRAHSRAALARWLASARREAGVAPGFPAAGPRAVVQILAGNVAGLALPAALEALLARSAVLLKPAAGDPVTPALLAESLRRAAPVLGAAVEVASWTGGDRAVEAPVFAAADFVIASGGEKAMDDLAPRLGRASLLHGPRFSVGVVGPGWTRAGEGWFGAVAREVALWDQKGCLSPRILFVSGDRTRFARALAGAMARRERSWPARPRTPSEASEVHAWRAGFELRARRDLFAPSGTAWTVGVDDRPSLEAGPPARAVRVTARPAREELAGLLAASPLAVQAAGLAHLGRDTVGWRRALAGAGVPLTPALTAIQDPPAGWRADGRSGLAELLRTGR